jgi:polygalacturonase
MKILPPGARRTFLQRAGALGVAALLAPLSRPVRAVAGGTVIDVRSKGARGDGKRDDTAAFQAAIDALPDTGGTVRVPAGNYMIDATRSIHLRSNMKLEMADDAQLTALPNARKRYHVLKVWRVHDVQISGGRIVGDRDQHQGSEGEWGYGINISASRNVTVEGTHLSGCWGDGMWIGALGKGPTLELSTDVTVRNVVSTNNRRQGLSMGPCRHVRILDCTFSDTHGTKPEAGIDLEPQKQGPTSDVLIEGCTITGNRGCGVEIHKNVSALVIRRCTIRDNDGYGVLAVGMRDLWVDGNTITGNGLTGVTIAGRTRDAKITGNTLQSNGTRYVHRMLKALASTARGKGGRKRTADLRIDGGTANITASGNTF